MPFTFAHPAAVVPRWNIAGRRLSLSALSFGSMIPDVAYFIPIGLFRYQTHSVQGLFIFCLPLGLILWWVFESFLKQPLTWLLPIYRDRHGHATTPTSATLISRPHALLIAAFSVLIGATTHVVWDALTHSDGFGVMRFPSLRKLLFVFDGYHVYVYKILQHGSTWLGLSLLAWWLWRWRSTLLRSVGEGPAVRSRWRIAVVIALVIFPMSYGVVSALPAFAGPTTMLRLQSFSGVAARAAVSVFLVSLATYSVAWHTWRFRAGR